jgi:hypothetical protein
MATLFSKIIKAITVGAGTVLSLFPATAAIGIPLLMGGSAINTTATVDKASAGASGVIVSINPNTGTASTTSLTGILNWFKTNPIVLIMLIGVAILLIPKLFKRRRS